MTPATEALHYTLPASVPTWAVLLLAAAAVGAWVAVHLLWRRPKASGARAARFLVCVAIGFGAMEAIWQAMQRGLVLATNWWLWPLSLLGAVAIEAAVSLYARERQTVSRGVGAALAALRVLLIALVVVMLARPVRTWNLDKTVQRWVAVLVDTSASMAVPDPQLSGGERLRLAERLGVPGARRPVVLDETAEALLEVRADLAAHSEWLASLAATAEPQRRAEALADRRSALVKGLTEARRRLVAEAQRLAEAARAPLKVEKAVLDRLRAARDRLTGPVRQGLKEAADLLGGTAEGALETVRPRLLALLRDLVQAVSETATTVRAAGGAFDEAAYRALPDAVRRAVDRAATQRRIALAQSLLLGPSDDQKSSAKPDAPLADAPSPSEPSGTTTPGPPAAAEHPAGNTPSDGPAETAAAAPAEGSARPGRGEEAAPVGLLEALRRRYSLQIYAFASEPTPLDADHLAEASPLAEALAKPPAALPPAQQQTDLTTVFDKVMSEMAEKRLSGILLLSDGRHNAPRSVEPLVRRLGVRQVPVSSVVFGGERPPIDAGIIRASAPETVAKGDRVLVTAEVKLDGLAGREVRVSLLAPSGRSDEAPPEVDAQTIRVPADTYRTRVRLAHKPEEARLHRYIVAVEAFDGEVLKSNNRYPLTVRISDERTQVLLIEGRPRWEFRYIKNLFSGRDRTVHLQYVLVHPDRIEGVPPPPRVPASASRPVDEVEATALPAEPAEWMKFDVIILGDVSPAVVGPTEQAILRRFVEERGGTLVVVAGPNYMPHAFAETPLADLLPVVAQPLDGPAAPPEESFHLALTAEGRESVLMQQKVNPAENLEVWAGMPPLYWRHPAAPAKPGARVLAYALPPSPPPYLPKMGTDPTDTEAPLDPEAFQKRREFERRHALISHHTVAAGRVLFLGFDRTWRLRYRVGDPHHHRFWGQVMRWATADKLPAGTETIKLGTDRIRYAPGQPVRVRARLAREDFTPLLGRDDVAVNVFAGPEKVMHQVLTYVPNSPGLYEASLGPLPSGTYRVELDAPAARPILRRQNAETVTTEFSVDPATPAEQVELAPDRGLLSRLAALTGGTVADPAHANRVLDHLGPATEVEVERREYVLWDSLPMLLVIVAVATAEWLLRKKVGLA